MNTREPSPLRVACVILGSLLATAPLVMVGRWSAQTGWLAAIAGVASAALAVLLIGAIGEWLVHRYAMHAGQRFPLFRLATELHHRAHHWVHFTPDRYVHSGPIEYPSVFGSRHAELASGTRDRVLTVASHASFYSLFAGPIVVSAWLLTRNPFFAASALATAMVLIALFIHIHDAVHYPGSSVFERTRWFWFLDHHHYIHHIDNKANTNFLLPLGDLLMGTLRLELTADELARWPSYANARRRVFDPSARVETKRAA